MALLSRMNRSMPAELLNGVMRRGEGICIRPAGGGFRSCEKRVQEVDRLRGLIVEGVVVPVPAAEQEVAKGAALPFKAIDHLFHLVRRFVPKHVTALFVDSS